QAGITDNIKGRNAFDFISAHQRRTTMIFSLEVRRARKGDCLLLHYGNKDDPGLFVIDGGPKNVFEPHLRPRLVRLAGKRGQPLTIDIMMVSHVDDDHIQGLLELAAHDVKADGSKRLVRVTSLWYNSIENVVEDSVQHPLAVFSQFGGASAGSGDQLSDEQIGEIEDHIDENDEDRMENLHSGLRILASIAQGDRLRSDANKLEWPLNAEFEGALICASETSEPIPLLRGLTLTVVGPQKPEIDALRRKHHDWLEEKAKKNKSGAAELAAYVDPSVTNLSSIVVLVQAKKKRMLLTGDARGDKILKGLKDVGLLGKKPLHVDVLKVPHHGSANNMEKGFFEQVTADHYVFSGDGEHGNPERETIEMLLQARGSDVGTIYLTYPIDHIDKERENDWNKERAKEVSRRKKKGKGSVRDPWSFDKNSLSALFATHGISPGKGLVIVSEDGDTIIDLMDPLEA
ncbi:ComEC/Rec2 family competence protein, partial [Sinorhizobium medicae]